MVETRIADGDNSVDCVDSGNYIKFITQNSEKMRIDSNGWLGIGTTAPGNGSLEIWATYAIITLRTTTHSDASDERQVYLQFVWEDSDGHASSLASIIASHDGTSKDSEGNLRFLTGDGSYGTATEKMRIDSAGKVGIGTTGPTVPWML